MELVFLLLTAATVFGFGYFWGYERKGGPWTAAAAFIFLQAAAVISAVTEADASTIAWQFCFNIIVFNSAAAGYQLGVPVRRPWWKKLMAGHIIAIAVLICYAIYLS